MPPRTKQESTPHTVRNDYLRDRVRRALHQAHMDAAEFRDRCVALATERNMKFFKSHKDTMKGIRNWLAGKNDTYYWALDVYELTVIDIEHQTRHAAAVGHGGTEAHTMTPAEAQRGPIIEPVHARTISSGTQAELDALRNIVTEFVPLKSEARQRVLRYLESL